MQSAKKKVGNRRGLFGTRDALSAPLDRLDERKKISKKKTGWAGCRSRKVIHCKPSRGSSRGMGFERIMAFWE